MKSIHILLLILFALHSNSLLFAQGNPLIELEFTDAQSNIR